MSRFARKARFVEIKTRNAILRELAVGPSPFFVAAYNLPVGNSLYTADVNTGMDRLAWHKTASLWRTQALRHATNHHRGGGIGKWVTSKQGFSAAVELRVTVSGKNETASLYDIVDSPYPREDDQPRSVTTAERDDLPEDNEWMQENSFEVMAWLPDGNLLLASQIVLSGG